MVGLVSRIKILFSSQGADKAAKATERVGRAQTRLGQTGAANARQFSAQAAGLGGLVTVYAGAAANIFAITMAFNALAKAAQAEQVIQGTRALAQEIGASGDEIISKIQLITKGQLSIVDTATQANAALSAGFSQEQIERLTVVSMKASRALGRDLTDSFGRLVRGAAKLEPELIDELGIFARIIPATEAYAAANNVAASSLTNYEKRQAFVNAIITEGEDKFQEINISSESTQESFERLLASVKDLATGFGQFVATVLTPIVDFFGGSVGNKMVLFGAIGALVFGKLRQVVGAFVGDTLRKLNLSLDATFAKMSKGGRKAGSELAASFAEARKAAKGTRVTRTGLSMAAGSPVSAADTKDILTRQAQIRKLTDKQSIGYREAGKGADLARLQIKKLGLAGITSGKQFVFAKAALTAFTAQTGTMGGVAKVAMVGVNGLSVAIKGVAIAIATVLPVLMAILIAFTMLQVVLSMFGFDLIGGIVNGFKSWGAASKETRAGLQLLNEEFARTAEVSEEIAVKLGGTSEDFVAAQKTNMQFMVEAQRKWQEYLKSISYTEEDVQADLQAGGIIEQFGAEAQRQAEAEVKALELIRKQKAVKRIEMPREDTGKIIFTDIDVAVAEREGRFPEKEREQRLNTLRDKYHRAKIIRYAEEIKAKEALAETDYGIEATITDLEKALIKLQGEISLTGDVQSILTAKMIEQLIIFYKQGDAADQDYRAMKRLAGQMKILGLSGAGVLAAMKMITMTSKDQTAKLMFGSIVIGHMVKSQMQFTETMKGFGNALALAAGAQARYNDRNEKGVLNAEKSAQVHGALATAVSKARREFRKGFAEEFGPVSFKNIADYAKKLEEGLQAIAEKFDDDLEASRKLRDSLKSIEQIGKSIRTIYGGAFKDLDNLVAKGMVDQAGNIASTTEEKAANAFTFLKDAAGFNNELELANEKNLKIAKQIADAEAQGDESAVERLSIVAAYNQLGSIEIGQLNVMNASRKTIAGLLVKTFLESQKLVKSQEKALRVARQQDKLGVKRLHLLQAQRKVADLKNIHKENQAASQAALETTKQYIKHAETLNEAAKARLDIAKKQLEIEKETMDIQRKAASAQTQLLKAQAEARGATRMRGAEAAISQEELMGSMTSPARLREAQSKVDEIKFQNTMNALDREESLIRLEAKQSLEDINMKKRELEAEKALLVQQKQANYADALSKDYTLREERTLEIQKVTDRKAEIVAEKSVLADQKGLAKLQARVNNTNRLAQLKLLNDQITFLETRTDLDDKMIKKLGIFLMGMAMTVQELGRITGTDSEGMQDALAKGQELAKGMDTQLNENIKILRQGVREQTNLSWRALWIENRIADEKEGIADDALNSEVRRLNAVDAEKEKQYRSELNRIWEDYAAKSGLNQVEIDSVKSKLENLGLETEAVENLMEAKLVSLGVERETAKEIIRLARLKAQVAKDLFFQIGESITSILKNKIGQGIRDLNTAFIEGTLTMDNFKQGLKDLAIGVLQGIQETILEKAIIKPIQNLIGEMMGDLFNLKGKPDGTVANMYNVRIDPTQVTQMSAAAGGTLSIPDQYKYGGPSRGINGGVESLEEDRAESERLFGLAGKDIKALGVTAVATFAATYAATGDWKKSMIATFLQMFMQIAMMQAMAMMGKASGGAVGFAGATTIQRFAAGGGALYRDRVPALLEPGEFVIRKPMAKAIGGPALERMNATGQMPTGNIEVNMVNKGTPKDAQVEQKPQIDGKGIVVDIVLKDLQNNGPIKQAIRGGGRR